MKLTENRTCAGNSGFNLGQTKRNTQKPSCRKNNPKSSIRDVLDSRGCTKRLSHYSFPCILCVWVGKRVLGIELRSVNLAANPLTH